MQKAAGAAAEIEASDQQTNDQMRSDYERAREMEAQNNAMIQHNLAQTDWGRSFANRRPECTVADGSDASSTTVTFSLNEMKL